MPISFSFNFVPFVGFSLSMFVSKDSDIINSGEDVFINNSDALSTEISDICSSEPLKIFVFPPKNKQFRFDEDTNKIEIEPLETSTPTENKLLEYNCNSEAKTESTLTPLVEKCSLTSDVNHDSDGTDNQPQKFSENQLKIQPILKIEKVFSDSKPEKNCFLKGCKWSGDGLCLLTSSEDNILRLFEVSETLLAEPQNDINPVLQMKEGGTVYDYVWYPKMNSCNPISCVFASTSQNSPIHLWDAYTGHLRATYQPINQYDEVTSAYSLAFSPDGSKLYSGFKKCLRIFDISYPGRISEERNLKPKGNLVFQTNIISCICVNPCMPELYALGSYDKTIGIYAEPDGQLLCVLKGHSGGITQVIFSGDGNYLFSGGRKDDEILCWDMRNPGKVVFSIKRKVDTQQKIQFDLNQTFLITGTTDCEIKIFDVSQLTNENILKSCRSWRAHEDCVNGVQFHPSLSVFASTSGQRHFPEFCDEDVTFYKSSDIVENSIKIWSFDVS